MSKYNINLFGRQAIEVFPSEQQTLAAGGQHYPLVGALINGELCGLNQPISFDSEVEGVYLHDLNGARLYRNSLAFLLLQSAYILARKAEPQAAADFRCLGSLTIGPTMGLSFYCYFEQEATPEQLQQVKQQMQTWVAADLPIVLKYITYARAQNLYRQKQEWREYLSLSNRNRIPVYSLGGDEELCNPQLFPCLHRTGLLRHFDLAKEQDGFLLRFPQHASPFVLDEQPTFFVPKFVEVYRSYKQWNRNVGVDSVAALVTRTEQKKGIEKLITLAEIHQQKNLAALADAVRDKKSAKLLLVAGPSSSGKTTFTKKLALQLEILGFHTVLVSLDNFYQSKDLAPKGKDGKPDLECLEALDLERLSQNLAELLGGGEAEFPIFDFAQNRTAERGQKLRLTENSILLLEGIHGLNPRLTPNVPAEQKFLVYISALTQLNILPSQRMPSSDNRLLRRIVRDYQFRGHRAHDTLAMWDSVQHGERRHIFPHQDKADAVFNSALEYEIPILKTYAAPLLKQVKPPQETYATAKRLENILSFFPSLPSYAVPQDSILREFIGGSSFQY